MKGLIQLTAIILFGSSFSAGAVNVKVDGTPVPLVPYQQIYQLPANYVPSSSSYLYVTINGVNNVCYTEPNASLTALNRTMVTIFMNGQNTSWNCYQTSTNAS